jgi:hypothetical protein
MLETTKKILVVVGMIFLIAYIKSDSLSLSVPIKSYCIIASYVLLITALVINIIQRKKKKNKT